MAVPISLGLRSGAVIEGVVLDLSHLGCFVKLNREISKHEMIETRFDIFGMRIQCEGVVVWCAESTVTHPRGIGIKFSPTDKVQKKSLRLMQKRLRKVKSLYRKYRYLLSQDDFLKKLEEIESGEDRHHSTGSRKTL